MKKCFAAAVTALSCVAGTWGNAAPAFTTPSLRPYGTLVDTAKGLVLVQGTVKAMTKPPRPGSVPYKDAVIAIRLVGVKALSGKIAQRDILVFAWGMRDNKWTTEAGYHVGQTIKLALQPWDDVADRYGGYNRIELQGDDVADLEAYWGVHPQGKQSK